MNEYWYDIQVRGLETVAVWTTFAPNFAVGELKLAQQAADVTLLYDHIQQRNTAQDDMDAARRARDAGAAQIDDLCVRACRVISGSLPPGESLVQEVRDVRGVQGRSQQGVMERARRLVPLWQSVNARRASMSPVLPALLVGSMDVGSFQSLLGNHAVLLQNVENKRAVWNQKKSQLQTTASRVDRNNKRWFEAWRGHFSAGTPERAALSQISTGASQTLPGQGVFLVVETLPNQVVRLTFDAARATQFTLLHQGPSAPVFTVLAEGLTVKTFEHAAQSAGSHTYKVVGRNAAGTGAESVPLAVSVAQQLAA